MQYILSAVSRQTVMDSLARKPKRIVEITGPVIFADSTVKALAEFGCQLEVGRVDVPVRVSGKMTTKEVRLGHQVHGDCPPPMPPPPGGNSLPLSGRVESLHRVARSLETELGTDKRHGRRVRA
jgi:hypothetical protein